MKVEVLGTVQDGGVPHLGCSCDICESAREDKDKQRYVSSLLLENDEGENSIRYLIGASPDIRFQLNAEYIDGILLVDNHFSHVTGLLYLGEFSMESSDIPVYTPDFMQEHLMKNDPYRFLVDRGNITLNQIQDGEEFELHHLDVQPRQVTQRRDTSGTYAYFIEGEERSLYYAPIVDGWSEEDIELIEKADIAIIEGCFWDSQEVPRYADQPPHPTIPATMEKVDGFDTDIYFIHMNHTNPVLREDSGERQELENRGFNIVEKGDEFEI